MDCLDIFLATLCGAKTFRLKKTKPVSFKKYGLCVHIFYITSLMISSNDEIT